MGQKTPAVQTVKNETVADPTTKAWQQALFGVGQNLYGQGPAEYYPGQTVAPYSSQTNQGLNWMEQQAMGGAPNYDAANQSAQRILTGQNPAMAYSQQFAQGSTAPQQQMAQYAQGSINPYIEGVFNPAAREMTNAVNAQFAKAGRFGNNAAYGGTLSRNIGDLYSQIAMPAFESAQARGLQAAGMLGNSQMAGADMYGQQYAQANQQAMAQQGMLPSLYEYGGMPAQQMLGVGGAREQMEQALIDANMAQWNFYQNRDWDLAQRYAGLMNGMPDFSSTTQTTTGAKPNRGMGMLGGAAAGAGLAASMGAIGAANMWNPLGWAMIGGGALLGSGM